MRNCYTPTEDAMILETFNNAPTGQKLDSLTALSAKLNRTPAAITRRCQVLRDKTSAKVRNISKKSSTIETTHTETINYVSQRKPKMYRQNIESPRYQVAKNLVMNLTLDEKIRLFSAVL